MSASALQVGRSFLLICSLLLLVNCGGDGNVFEQNPPSGQSNLDLRNVSVASNRLTRVSGFASAGNFGVPVAGGYDCDDDGSLDYALGGMVASPLSRSRAGQVSLIFGNGTIGEDIDTAVSNDNVLTIIGAARNENAGSEIWMDDVTGDGVGDLLIARQNYREPVSGRIGAGALTVVVGNAVLRDFAANSTTFDLANPPATATVFTIVGAAELDRLGIWMRTGDVTGDGVADILVGADQEDNAQEANRGAAYLIRGGSHLNATQTIDLAEFGSTAIAGHIAKITPPPGSAANHFGATVTLGDLDNNGLSEVLIAATLNRAGADLLADDAPSGSAQASSGNSRGSMYILWDDNFPAGSSWADGFTFSVDTAPGTTTRIDGGSITGQFTNERLGEEMLAGLDYNNDAEADLFVGDITGTSRSNRLRAGVGHVFFSASALKGQDFSMNNPPANVDITTILGSAESISSDTTLHGDINNDGIDDLVIGAPHESPSGRTSAGAAHVLWGQSGTWPDIIDLQSDQQPERSEFAITSILGANGTSGSNEGDTLMYSAAAADMNGDGKIDLIINEMLGDGVAPATVDVGNLIIISGDAVPR